LRRLSVFPSFGRVLGFSHSVFPIHFSFRRLTAAPGFAFPPRAHCIAALVKSARLA